MTEVTIDVGPSYLLHERIVFMHVDEVRERWDELLRDYRHFSFFWMPTADSSQLYGFPPADADMCMVKLYQEWDGQEGSQPVESHERIDRSYRIYPHEFEPNFHELEYFLPISDGPDAFERQRKLMLANLPDSIFPMEVRFVAADDSWISPNYQRETMVISVSGKPGTDYWPYLKTCDTHLAEHGGRPHWGKLHFMSPDRMTELFPKYEAFKRVRREFDPEGVFLNDFLHPLFA